MSFRPETSHFKPICSQCLLSRLRYWHLSFNHAQMCAGHEDQNGQLAPVVHIRSVGPRWNLEAKTYVWLLVALGCPWSAHPFLPVPQFWLYNLVGRENQVDLRGTTKPLDGTISCTGFGWTVGRTYPLRGWQRLRPQA